MRMRVGLVVLLVACGEVAEKKPDGGSVGDGSMPDSAPCQAVVTECTSANVLHVCSAVGQPSVDTTCDLGCSDTGGAHCRTLQPSFQLTAQDLAPTAGLAEITLSATSTLNSSDGSITNLRAAGTGVISGIDFSVRNGVGIFRFQKLTINGGNPAQSLSLRGTNAIAIVAVHSIQATGTIFDAQGDCTQNAAGPGGTPGGGFNNMPGTRDGKRGILEPQNEDGGSGGGGGAHVGNGGTGGTGLDQVGAAGGQGSTTLAFAGGGGGGNGASSGAGGGGGGAVHLAANVLVKIDGGGVNAGGCGGNLALGGAGGGGAGGMIVIEASDVELANAGLAANGGGGGGQARGTHGRLSLQAAGGGAAGSFNAAGGLGGSNTTLNGGNGGAGNTNVGGGGGGGGVGRIVLKSSDGLITTGNAFFSPASMNGTVPIN